MTRIGRLWPAAFWAASLAVAAPAEDRLQAAYDLLGEAGTLYAAGKLDEAAATIKEARAKAGDEDPGFLIESWMLEARVEAARAKYDAALAALAKITGAFADAPPAPEAALLAAQIRAAADQPIAARTEYQRVIEQYPDSWSRMDAERGLIRLALGRGDLADAARQTEAYLTRYPWTEDGPWLLDELGRAQLGAKNFADAAASFERIRADYAGTQGAFEARRGLVDAYRGLERVDDALKVLADAAAQGLEMFALADITFLRADMLAGKDDRPAAAAELGALAARYPGTFVAAEATLRQAQLLLAAERADEAVAALEALRLAFDNPYWKAQLLRALMATYHQAKLYEKAEDAAAELVDLAEGTPLAASALLQMAQSQRAGGRDRAARASLERLVQRYKGPPFAPIAEALIDEWSRNPAPPAP